MTTDAISATGALFSDSYAQARLRFQGAVERCNGELTSYPLRQLSGPEGGSLSCDVARLGPRNASDALVLVSGTHGIEGYAGSAVQCAFLEARLEARRDPEQALVLVHALNPFGFAHLRRVNEDNVDVNRNFVRHESPPHNPGYALLHGDLVPRSWSGPERSEADGRITALLQQRGLAFVQEAITRGQYEFPDGLFYGGKGPCWSNLTWRRIVRTHLARFERIAYVDLHTGLGAWGEGEPIFRGGLDPHAYARAREWYGEALTTSEDGTSSSTPIVGNTASALAEELPEGVLLTAITLELGTQPAFAVLQALRGDNWLQLREAADAETRANIRAAMDAAFRPPDVAWRGAVLRAASSFLARAVRGLRGEASG